ncbi:MAG: putative lipid II flippase FtsW [Deltaproteobacteria bacterium]|nr:putative lipid II flippase FtsW [Deltaproteobacteria bacterium]MBW2018545.1 putative lipid II flippase FtsW [Deltaproteobacteria bacterium]MBW2073280.1 putative lipid II flippase FtsW [Deltaproteobacteria bacterium]RLB83332.1 MAG: putative lipid II flippase FtsW [Deltaproteobacteria bacterium]
MTDNNQTKDRGGYDGFLLLGMLLLLGIGVVMVYSASSVVSLKRFGSGAYFFKRQVVYALAAILVLIICRHVPYLFYRKMAYPILVVAFLLLVALYLPGVGHPVGGARRWLKVFGLSFQPSEFARLALVIYLAYSMSKKQEKIKVFAVGFLPHVVVLATFGALIVMQPDFGMAAMLVFVVWTMLFVGGVRLSYLLTAVAGMLPIAYYILIHAGYRLRRLTSFLDPWTYQSDAGYQIVHSLMAFGSGGVFGTGIGNSYQKLFYLPEPHTDFIFSVLGEELGLVGVCLVMGLYAMILWRGIVVAMKARDLFATYLAVGLISALGLQVCVNVGVTMGLLPTKGLTLPFVSYGGTSLVMNAAAVGILMNISARQAV